MSLELSWCQGTKLIRKASTKFKNVKYDNELSVSLGKFELHYTVVLK